MGGRFCSVNNFVTGFHGAVTPLGEPLGWIERAGRSSGRKHACTRARARLGACIDGITAFHDNYFARGARPGRSEVRRGGLEDRDARCANGSYSRGHGSPGPNGTRLPAIVESVAGYVDEPQPTSWISQACRAMCPESLHRAGRLRRIREACRGTVQQRMIVIGARNDEEPIPNREMKRRLNSVGWG